MSIAHALDYSSHIKFVRDSGAEGSVVGLALATALEYQIAKATHNDLRISARYIYYAGRAENVGLNAPYGKGPAVFGMTRSPRVEGIVLV